MPATCAPAIGWGQMESSNCGNPMQIDQRADETDAERDAVGQSMPSRSALVRLR